MHLLLRPACVDCVYDLTGIGIPLQSIYNMCTARMVWLSIIIQNSVSREHNNRKTTCCWQIRYLTLVNRLSLFKSLGLRYLSVSYCLSAVLFCFISSQYVCIETLSIVK